MAVRTDFQPLAPIRHHKANGITTGYGLGASTNAARGTALAAAITAAGVGDLIEVYANCDIGSISIKKDGVRVKPMHGAVITDTNNLPAIDLSDLSTANNVIYRGREATLFESDPRFCLWSFGFETNRNYANTVFTTSGPTLTVAGGTGTYVSAGGATSATLMGSPRPKVGQFTCGVLVNSHNASPGATYNDLFVGMSLTTTTTSDTVQYRCGAIYRRTESLNQIFLHYTYSGGSVETTPVTITETQPFYLIYMLNHNSATVAIMRLDGTWKVINHQEISLSPLHLDMEDITTVTKMRPSLYFQSNGPQTTVVRDWWVRALGTFGEREHMVVRYENGEPVRNADGYYYISVDDIGPNTATLADNNPNSAYMRCTHGVYLLDAKTGRRVRTTAKFYQQVATRTFGTQEGFIMCDRNTGLWHLWFSEWNYSGGGAVKIYHATSYQSPLELGMKVFAVGELTQNTALLSVISAGGGATALYSTNVRKINDTWYMAGIVAGFSSGVSRRVYLVSDDNPDFSSPTLVWRNDTEAAEGGYLWHVGPNWYVSFGAGANTVKAYDLAGTPVYSHGFPGNGRYDPFMDLLEVVEGGKTRYIFLAFSDTPADGHGEDFYDGVAYNNVAFGSRMLVDGGTFPGEQYTETMR